MKTDTSDRDELSFHLEALRQKFQRSEHHLELCPEDQFLHGTQWSLHGHVEHLCVTGRSTPKQIQAALDMDDDQGPELNDKGQLLFDLRAFPRGKTQAPEFAHPKGQTPRKMQQGFKRLRAAFEDLAQESPHLWRHTGRSLHPALGGLTPRQWFIFVDMHFAHHLEIISEGLVKE